jgi:hypothetical protein
VFDKAVIYCTRRKDATYLALLTVKDPAIVDPEEITRLLAEFRSAAQSPVPSDHEQPANAV